MSDDFSAHRDLADLATFLHMAVGEYFERKYGGYTSRTLTWDEEDSATGLIDVAVAQPNHKEDRVFEVTVREVTADTARGIVMQDAERVVEHRSPTGSRWSRPIYPTAPGQPGQPRICSASWCENFGHAHEGAHTRKPSSPLGRSHD